LTSSLCSGYCPKGTYGEFTGLSSVNQCKPCPPGTYASIPGSQSSACSSSCPLGTYNDVYGSKTVRDCKKCPYGYRGWQCTWAVQPSDGSLDTDHQHLETFGLPPGFKDPIPKKSNRLRTSTKLGYRII
jgi:hypothetical protein